MLPQAPALVIDYKDLKLAGIIAAGGGGVVAKGRFGSQKVRVFDSELPLIQY
jgi:hypothetical protein